MALLAVLFRVIRPNAVGSKKVDDVKAKTVHPLRNPEIHHPVNFLFHRGVGPVEIHLAGREFMVIKLAGVWLSGPRAAGKERTPVIRLAAKKEIITIAAARIIPRIAKPGMF